MAETIRASPISFVLLSCDFSNTTERALKIASELVRHGFPQLH
jgi:hypothetical protein